MTKRLIALASYSLFWLVFFIFARLFFILSQFRTSFANSAGELLSTFIHGSALDISTTGYFLLLPFLLAIPSVWIEGQWYRIFMRYYTLFLIVLSSALVVGDATLYSYWGFRMDYTPLLYLKTPGEAMASVSTAKAIMFFVTIGLMAGLFIYLYMKLPGRLFSFRRIAKHRLITSLFFLVLCGSLIIPIRGGFGVAPINAGSVYFSSKMYLNHTAVNVVWNVGTTALTQKPVKNPYEFGDDSEARGAVENLMTDKSLPVRVLNTRNPNILILVLESFSSYLIGPLGGDSLVTPNFNRYAREGLLFTNFYASGTRTDKAMPAILDGYPAQPAQSIIKEPKKSQSLPSIIRMLGEMGYSSSFWYGGDINFANFNSFVIGSGFNRIVTMDDFDPADYNSKWGVHDHVLFSALRDSMKNMHEPFVQLVLTLSSHEPFDVPGVPFFEGSGNLVKYKNSVRYADNALGGFLDWAKGTGWWKNTLVIMLADHCCRISADTPAYSPELFRIPMVWTGGALAAAESVVSKFGSQVDLAPTLMNQLDHSGDFPFSKDLFSNGSASFAFYTYNEGFGFITDSSAYVYDHKLRKEVISEGKDPESAGKLGKAYLQVLFGDYLRR